MKTLVNILPFPAVELLRSEHEDTEYSVAIHQYTDDPTFKNDITIDNKASTNTVAS